MNKFTRALVVTTVLSSEARKIIERLQPTQVPPVRKGDKPFPWRR